MRQVESRLRVRYAETDQMGFVYYANYLVWMEVGRVEYCRAMGLRYREMEEQAGVLLAVVEAHCRYASPARYDDEVSITTRLTEANARMVRFEYEIRDAESTRMLASGETKHIFLGRDGKPRKLPEQYRSFFEIKTA
jgi:acyl-CoA thioester hydrolase